MTVVDAIKIGHRVRVLRTDRRMRQQDLAKAANVSRNTITDLEAGRTPSLKTIQRVANALQVKIGVLLDDTPPRLPEMPHWP